MNSMQEPAASNPLPSAGWSGLTKFIDQALDGATSVVEDYNRVFQGDPVGEQYLAVVSAPAAPAPAAVPAASGQGAPSGVVLVTEDDVLPALYESLQTTVFPALVEAFGMQQLLENQDAMLAEVTLTVSGQVQALIEELAMQAGAELTAPETLQTAE
ncbi:hypothetical protein AB0E69_04190 [Kribbella sp. NPDC026611]|uniref:hypothetical protein n=1 Tax=Kribbella sp. NPDC026611 TaxID=3154911 RepID=UPI0033D6A321